MLYGWNPEKRASNLAKHGVDFSEVEDFAWETALVRADVRQHYGEVRLNALGLIGDRLHVLTFTIRRAGLWLISLRKANNKEVERYEGYH